MKWTIPLLSPIEMKVFTSKLTCCCVAGLLLFGLPVTVALLIGLVALVGFPLVPLVFGAPAALSALITSTSWKHSIAEGIVSKFVIRPQTSYKEILLERMRRNISLLT